MATLVYNYQTIDPNTGAKGVPNITVKCDIKLVIINQTFDVDGGVIDSSPVFYSTEIKIPQESEGTLPKGGISKDVSSQLRISLGDAMTQSENFKKYWDKWVGICGDRGYDPRDIPSNIPVFGLQVQQTFKGDLNFVGFSRIDNVIPGFFGASDGKYPFSFWDTTVGTVTVNSLTFNQQSIIQKQVDVAVSRVAFTEALKNYQAQLIAQSDELIISTYEYQPTNFVNVITRLLEFQEGTLITSLDFAENANLTQLYSLLNGINNEIESLSGLYPSITINDGEGIPYGDGIPAFYEFFGWGYTEQKDDIFSLVNTDGSSVSNFGILNLNGVEILDTRDYIGTLKGLEYFTPSEYIDWGEQAGFVKGDVLEFIITLTDYTDNVVNFVKTNFGQEIDIVSTGVTIARGVELGIYNSLYETEWDSNISPSGTSWNSIYTDGVNNGWSNLNNVSGRTYDTFYNALDQNINGNIIGLELVMHDEITDEYWLVKFSQYNSSAEGGGFEYVRKLVNPTGTLRTFKDTLIWK